MVEQHQPTYIFFDETGDLDFSEKGTKHYIVTAVIVQPPFTIDPHLHEYKYRVREFMWRNNQSQITHFHANRNTRYVKESVYRIIDNFSGENYRFQTFIYNKSRNAHKPYKDFYKSVYSVAIGCIVDQLYTDGKTDYLFLLDKKPIHAHDQQIIKEIKETIADFRNKDGVSSSGINYDISFEDTSHHYGLQIADYLGYAVFQSIERNNFYYYNFFDNIIIERYF